jgi:ribosomal protein S18 acetylase RimI-like enzyme
MYSIETGNETLYFKDIKPDSLCDVLDWCNRTNDMKYAAGMDMPITMKCLSNKYKEVYVCGSEFFCGIYQKESGRLIGLIKGSLHNSNKDTVWIKSIVIEPSLRNRGYGKMTVSLLMEHLNKRAGTVNAFLSVLEENMAGRAFWRSLGFKYVRRINGFMKMNEELKNVFIMYADIYGIRKKMHRAVDIMPA